MSANTGGIGNKMWKKKELSDYQLKLLVYNYRNPEIPVSQIAFLHGIHYKNVWFYMKQAIGKDYISFEEYKQCSSLRNSHAKKEERNPNYDSRLVTSEYRESISKAMTGKTIPQSVRDKISQAKKKGGKSLADKI